ncbi:MAG: type 1 glutamine amidotransferase [Lapillicoccus sp.]
MTAPVLVVQHEPECPPGLVGAGLAEAGLALDVVHPYAGAALPSDLAGHAGLVVLGGHMGANDEDAYPWLSATKALVRAAAATEVPVLGICLGHQLAAVALGGEVRANPGGVRRGVLDMGWVPAAAFDPVTAGCGARAVHWHHDIVTRAPEGTQELARAATGELTAARYAPTVWGVQCHPEADPGIVAGWAARGRSEAGADRGEVVRVDVALVEVEQAADALRAAWRPLATSFADRVREGAVTRAVSA